MSSRKKELRKRFRDAVFARDEYRCVTCGFQSSAERAEHELDAHHICPRESMPNGGYVKENGVTLCDPTKSGGRLAQGCHYRAEEVLLMLIRKWGEVASVSDEEQKHIGGGWPGEQFTPQALYKAVGSSYVEAVEASGYLK